MRVRHLLSQNDNDRIAPDVGAAPADLPMRIEHDSVGPGVALGEPWLARKRLLGRSGIRFALGELRAGDAADEPRIAAQFVVNAFEQLAARPFRSLAAVERAAVHAGDHQTDDMRFHFKNSLITRQASRLPRGPRAGFA